MQLEEVATVFAGLAVCVVLPGFLAARFVSGVTEPLEVAWQSVLFAVLAFTPVVYPAALVVGAPTRVAATIALVGFSGACVLFGRGWLRGAFWNLERPAPWAWIACGFWIVAAFRASRLSGDGACDSDLAYFYGMVRELGRATPAYNPELGNSLLTQSSGYWFWYACIQRFTGFGTATALWLAGSLVAIALMMLVHRVSRSLWKSELAAMASVVLLWIPSEPFWVRLASGRAFHAPRPYKAFARSLAIAWYDGPALILLLLCLGSVVRLVQRPKDRAALVLLFAVLVVFPFHHAMYYGITLCGLFPYVVWAVATRRLPRVVLSCFVTWVPWKLANLIWPQAMLAGDPRFTLDLATALPDLKTTLLRHSLLLPFAALAAWKKPKPGSGVLLVALLVLLLPGPWAGDWNRHWQWDPLSLVLSILAGAGIGHIVEHKGRGQAAAALLWAAPNVVVAGFEGVFRPPSDPAASGAACRPPAGLVEAARWIRANTPPEALVATPPASLEGQYVEVYGERRLVFGDALHLDMVDPPAHFRPAEADMARVFELTSADELDRISARRRFGYVVVRCRAADACPPVRAMLPVRFASGAVSVLEAARPAASISGTAPASR